MSYVLMCLFYWFHIIGILDIILMNCVKVSGKLCENDRILIWAEIPEKIALVIMSDGN